MSCISYNSRAMQPRGIQEYIAITRDCLSTAIYSLMLAQFSNGGRDSATLPKDRELLHEI